MGGFAAKLMFDPVVDSEHLGDGAGHVVRLLVKDQSGLGVVRVLLNPLQTQF